MNAQLSHLEAASDLAIPPLPVEGTVDPGPGDLAVRARRTLAERYVDGSACSTGALADEFGVTASHLCHVYKDAWGVTIGSDVRRLRIELAKRLLAYPELSIKQVAGMVGYRDATYRAFFNAFREETGMPPSRYRRATLRSYDSTAELRTA